MNHKTVPENSRINSFHQAVVVLRHKIRHRRIAGDKICCQHIRNIVSVVSLILTVILTFVSFFIMSNTIKLTTFGRREEIAIMKMVGATNSFIRTPFVIEGLILGLLGGVLGFLAVWGIYTVLNSSLLDTLTGSFISLIPFNRVMLPMLAVYVGVGVLIGVFGGVNAIRNYLKV